jgi:hypothetical protein
MANYSKEQVLGTLYGNPEYQKSSPDVQKQWEVNTLKNAGLATEPKSVAPQAGLRSQDQPISIPDTLTASPKLWPAFSAIDKMAEFMGVRSRPGEEVQKAAIPALATAVAPEITGPLKAVGLLRAGYKLGPIGQGLVEGAANAGATAINQATGVEPPSNLAIPAAVPLVARGLTGGLATGGQALTKRLPGSAAIQNEMAAKEATQAVDTLRPLTSAQTLFGQLQGTTASVPATGTSQLIGDLLAHEQSLSKGAQLKGAQAYLEGLQEKLTASGGNLNALDLHNELVRLGQFVRQSDRAAGPESSTYRKIFKSLNKDMDAAVTSSPDIPLLKQARQTSKRELAIKDLEEWIDVGGATKINRGQGGDIQFNANYVLKKMETDPLFSQSFPADDLAKMKATFERLNTAPVLDTPANVNAGSMRALGKYSAMGAIGGALNPQDRPEGVAAGLAIAWLGPKATAWAVGTARGRALVEKILTSNKGVFDHRGAAIIAAAAEGALQETAPPPAAAPQPAPEPKAEKKGKKTTRRVLRDEHGRISAIETESEG